MNQLAIIAKCPEPRLYFLPEEEAEKYLNFRSKHAEVVRAVSDGDRCGYAAMAVPFMEQDRADLDRAFRDVLECRVRAEEADAALSGARARLDAALTRATLLLGNVDEYVRETGR